MNGGLMSFWAALLLGGLQEEKVENPEYTAWASFKPGSTAVIRESEVKEGIAQEEETELTLLQVSDVKVLLKRSTRRFVDEDQIDLPPQEQEIHHWIPRAYVSEPLESGIEEIRLGGKSLTCRWREIEIGGIRIRTWTAREIPGGRVRRRFTSLGATPSVTLQELVRWNAAS